MEKSVKIALCWRWGHDGDFFKHCNESSGNSVGNLWAGLQLTTFQGTHCTIKLLGAFKYCVFPNVR